jgi:deoxyuridine 5'-triphosphate nucleotidohydrolase
MSTFNSSNLSNLSHIYGYIYNDYDTLTHTLSFENKEIFEAYEYFFKKYNINFIPFLKLDDENDNKRNEYKLHITDDKLIDLINDKKNIDINLFVSAYVYVNYSVSDYLTLKIHIVEDNPGFEIIKKYGKFDYEENTMTISDINLLDFLGFIHERTINDHAVSSYLFSLYRKLAFNIDDNNTRNLVMTYSGNSQYPIGNIKWSKNHKDAVAPKKARFSDVGWDLTLIKKNKDLTKNTSLYDTGISVSPPPGYYLQICPRSSLSKSGYILANSVGIIDPSYTGNILVALTKTDESKEDITFPFIAVQMILKPVYYSELEEVSQLSETERGHGGFGSTDIQREKKE